MDPRGLVRSAAVRQWEQIAAGLAVAAALAWLVSRLVGGPGGLGQASGVVTNIVVPAVAAWWAARRRAPHGPLGLAALAAWGAAFHLPALLGALVLPGPGPPAGAGPGAWAALGRILPSGVAVAALVAALLALRARGDRRSLGAPGPRRGAAVAILLWGAAEAAAAVLRASAAPMAPEPSAAGPVLTLVVVAAIAAVVWWFDRAVVVAAVVVLTIGAVMRVLGTLSITPGLELEGGAGVAAAVSAGGAALLAAAALRLTRATQVLP